MLALRPPGRLSIHLLAAITLLGCGSPNSSDQSPIVTSISGLVYDTDTTKPLGMAIVETEPATQGVTTNAEGRYVISFGVQSGTRYRVTAARSGYQSASREVTAAEGQNANVDIGLLGLPGQLWVDPTVLDFKIAGEGKATKTFAIQNKGDGTVEYALTVAAPAWLGLTSSAGSTTGGTLAKAETHTLTVTADASKLAGATAADATVINVTSKAGNASVAVKLAKVSSSCFALGFFPGQNIDFGVDKNVLPLRILNTGGGPMKWTATQTASWLTVAPAQGEAGAGESTDLTLTVDRAKLDPGGHDVELAVSASSADGNPDCKQDDQLIHVHAVNGDGCVCTPDSIRCASESEDPSAKKIFVCQGDCAGEYESTCPAKTYCGQNQVSGKQECIAQFCAPNQYKCKNGSVLGLCNAKGSAFQQEIVCATGQVCAWSDAAQHEDCICKGNCEYNGAPKQCGDDGCGQPCSIGCDPLNQTCIEPQGICQDLSAAEKNCDPSLPHGTFMNAPMCMGGSLISSAGAAMSSGCFSSSAGYCLVADTFDACGPGNGTNDSSVPGFAGIASANYRIEYTIIVH